MSIRSSVWCSVGLWACIAVMIRSLCITIVRPCMVWRIVVMPIVRSSIVVLAIAIVVLCMVAIVWLMTVMRFMNYRCTHVTLWLLLGHWNMKLINEAGFCSSSTATAIVSATTVVIVTVIVTIAATTTATTTSSGRSIEDDHVVLFFLFFA